MSTRIIKRACLPVGSYQQQGKDKPTVEYRDIGVLLEHENNNDGNKWLELKFNLDILHPALFMLAKAMADKGSSSARVKLFDVVQKRQDKSGGHDDGPPADDDWG